MTQKTTFLATIPNGQSISGVVAFDRMWLSTVRVVGTAQGTHFVLQRAGVAPGSLTAGYLRDALNAKLAWAFTAGDWVEDNFNELAPFDNILVQLCSSAAGAAQAQSQATVVELVGVSL